MTAHLKEPKEPKERRDPSSATPARLVFAKNHRKFRRDKQLSQADIEKITGIPRTTLSDMERGKQNVTVDMIYRLASAIGCPYHALLQP